MSLLFAISINLKTEEIFFGFCHNLIHTSMLLEILDFEYCHLNFIHAISSICCRKFFECFQYIQPTIFLPIYKQQAQPCTMSLLFYKKYLSYIFTARKFMQCTHLSCKNFLHRNANNNQNINFLLGAT